jgi:hypothetical protein
LAGLLSRQLIFDSISVGWVAGAFSIRRPRSTLFLLAECRRKERNMTRILAVVLLVIVPFFWLQAFASEADKNLPKNSKPGVSVAKSDKELPDSETRDLDGSLKIKKPESDADHDHYGKFLIFKALTGRGSRR